MNGVLDLAVCVLAMIVAVGVLHWVIARPRRAADGYPPTARRWGGRPEHVEAAPTLPGAPAPLVAAAAAAATHGIRSPGRRPADPLLSRLRRREDRGRSDPGWGGTA